MLNISKMNAIAKRLLLSTNGRLCVLVYQLLLSEMTHDYQFQGHDTIR